MSRSRQEIIAGLESRYADFTTELYEALRHKHFLFESQDRLHGLHLDKALIVRHSLPYCISEEAFFDLDHRDVAFLSAVILLHSLALTKIDDYYDGGNQTKPTPPLHIDHLAYSLSATHQAIVELTQLAPDSQELLGLMKITNFTHARMYQDYSERYQIRQLDTSSKQLARYLYSPQSRLLGSGYWEVMARAAFAQRGRPFPAYLHSIDIKLRKFRQIIDELGDVEEDLRGGLITLPLLHGLSHHNSPQLLRTVALQYWRGHESPTALKSLLNQAGSYQWVYAQAMHLYRAASKEIEHHLPRWRGENYQRLFEYKRLKLETLVE